MQRVVSKYLAGAILALFLAPLTAWGQVTAPPPGGLIAYTSTRGTQTSIYVIQPNGQGGRRLVANGADPAFSPDGGAMVFVRGADLYLVDTDGTNVRRVTNHGVGVTISNPVFNTDGSRILFNMAPVTRNPVTYIRMVETDGANELTIANPGMDPTFTPDGTRVIFARGTALYNMSTNTMAGPAYTPFQLYPFGAGFMARYPAVNLNGEIAYSIRPTTANAVWSIHLLRQGQPYPEVVLARDAQQPAYAGRYIVFVRNNNLFLMDANGANQRPITSGAPVDTNPAWSPST